MHVIKVLMLALIFSFFAQSPIFAAESSLQDLQKAAEAGDAKAQSELGQMYYFGNGVSEDDQKAREWFEKAAAQGDAWAQVLLGDMYHGGKGGWPKGLSESPRIV